MSVDKFAFLGAYITVGKIKIKHDAPEVGCSACKTHNSKDRFCGHCGAAHTDYSKSVTARSFGDLMDLAYDRGDLSPEQYDNLQMMFWLDGPIHPMSRTDIGFEHEVTYEFEEMTMPDVSLDDAAEYYKDVISLLVKYEIPYVLKRGIMFYCR